VLAGHPLDTLRVRTQQPGAGSPRAVWTATLAGEGGRALFKGLSSPLAAAAAQNALCFHTFASAMRALAEEPPESAVAADLKRPHSHTHVFLAGCAAGVATTALATPIELLKVQLQARVLCCAVCPLQLLLHELVTLTPERALVALRSLQVRVGRGGGPLALAASILAREGPAGLYRGASITLARDAPSTGVYYVVYEARAVLQRRSRCYAISL
jgi:solute carrier family 25 carnitine/acylcarnitine transporter 20/29